MKLYEIEPGIWIVPELVVSVIVHPFYTGMTYEGYSVLVGMVGGNNVAVRAYTDFGKPPETRVGFVTASDWIEYGQKTAREVVAWIDERRTEPLEVVRA